MRLELKESEIIWMGRSSSKPEGFMIPTHLKVSIYEIKNIYNPSYFFFITKIKYLYICK